MTLAHITGQAPSTSKPIINLGLGDPTHYPLHPPPPGAQEAVSTALHVQRSNGYLPGPGSVEARRAVADYHAKWDGVSYLPEDIALVSSPFEHVGIELMVSDTRSGSRTRHGLFCPLPLAGPHPPRQTMQRAPSSTGLLAVHHAARQHGRRIPSLPPAWRPRLDDRPREARVAVRRRNTCDRPHQPEQPVWEQLLSRTPAGFA